MNRRSFFGFLVGAPVAMIGGCAAATPLVAPAEVVRGDMQIWTGGIMWIDTAYDERIREAAIQIG